METKHTDRSHQCMHYPGGYFPLLDEQQLSRALKQSRKVNTVSPPVKLSEEDDFYKIEAALPGLHREDFFICIDDDILSISILHKQSGNTKEQCFKVQEFNYDCFNRKLTLPVNAESSFIQAEYKEGMLNMYLPKSAMPIRQAHMPVVVY